MRSHSDPLGGGAVVAVPPFLVSVVFPLAGIAADQRLIFLTRVRTISITTMELSERESVR